MDPQARQGFGSTTSLSAKESNRTEPVDEPFRFDDGPEDKTTGFDNAHRPDVSRFYRAQQVADRRIHIYGMGSAGTLVAHAFRGIPNPPPVSLIFHKRELIKQWEESSKELRLRTDNSEERRRGYDVELARPRPRYHRRTLRLGQDPIQNPHEDNPEETPEPQVLDDESTEPIHSLILCMKATQVLSALEAIKHRLYPDSVILFLQNGIGTIDEVNKEIFPDPATRPHYMLGINSHGINRSGKEPFAAVHAGFGTIALTILPPEREDQTRAYAPSPAFDHRTRSGASSPTERTHSSREKLTDDSQAQGNFPFTPNSRYLLRTLLRVPVLCATAFPPSELLQMQLEKLVVNSIINPLTVLLDARNGALLYNFHLARVTRLLLSETSLVIRSLPELAYIPNVAQRFDPGRLETIVWGVAGKTKDNISSMLADAREGRKTEIEYINGWVVKKGEEMGVKCVMNYMMMQMVKGKQGMIAWELSEAAPVMGLEDREIEEGGSLRFHEGISSKGAS